MIGNHPGCLQREASFGNNKNSFRSLWWRSVSTVVAFLMACTIIPGQVFADDPHMVVAGETLEGIANWHGTSVVEIIIANALANPNLIVTGTVLKIHTQARTNISIEQTRQVRLGDTLTGIAYEYGVSLSELAAVNGIRDVDQVLIGQVLKMPQTTLVSRSPGQAASLVTPGQPASQTFLGRGKVAKALRQAANEFGVDLRLLQALAYQESGWQQQITSSAGAVGVLQVMPGTATWATEMFFQDLPDWRSSELGNARVGASVLQHLLKLSGGDIGKALAAYYQGWASVETIGIMEESQAYVDNILALTQMNRWYDFGPAPWIQEP